MDKTTHYGLNKPGYDEPADIAALNENADITDTVLAGKVDKVSGKQLSTEDYTTAEKTKLAGVEAGANNYSHPATHSADMIEDNPAKRFVNETQIATWSTKETPAGAQAKADAAENNAKAYAGDKSALLTTEKTTIVSAVNELFTNVGNGKDLIASAITGKGVPASGSDTFPVLAGKIEDIPAGGEYGTATAAEVLEGYTLGTEGGVVNGALALSGDALPANVLAGKTFYNTNAKSKLTGTIPAKGSQTYTPGTTNQVIAAGQYLSGVQTIAGSENLIAANIRDGINVFGVVGTLQEGTQFITYNSPAMTIGNNVAQDTVFWTFSIPSRPKYLSFERVYNLTGTEANHFYIDSLSEFPWSYLDGLSNVQFNYANIFGPPNPIQYDNSEFFLFYVQNYSDTTAEYRVSIGINLIGGTTITFKKKESAIYSQTWDLPAGAWKIHAGF